MRRKFLSVLLAMTMVLTLAPVTALAADPTHTIAFTPDGGELAADGNVKIEAKKGEDVDSTVTILYATEANKIQNTTVTKDEANGIYEYSAALSASTLLPDGTNSVTIYAVAVAGETASEAQVSAITPKEFTKKSATTNIESATVTIKKPVKDAAPADATVANTVNYTVKSTTWNPAVAEGGKFAADKQYTATVVLTANQNYAWKSGIAAANITVADAEIKNVSVNGSDLSFDAVFPKTDAAGENPDPGTPGLTITPSTVSISAGKVGTDMDSVTFAVSDGKAPYTVAKKSGPDWLNASISGTTVTISATNGKRPATAQAATTLVLTITDSTPSTPLTKDVSVTVGKVEADGGSGSGSGSGSSGGSSNNNNTNNDSSVKVPVSGDDHGVDVSADVSGILPS